MRGWCLFFGARIGVSEWRIPFKNLLFKRNFLPNNRTERVCLAKNYLHGEDVDGNGDRVGVSRFTSRFQSN